MTAYPFKLLLLSTPVGPLGSGLGGGVELTLYNLAQYLIQRGHKLKIVAPSGSEMDNIPVKQIPGNLQITAQTQKRTDPICLPEDSVLANMWDYARQVEANYDLIFNIAYDWLPLYLTPFFDRPIAHFISMGSLSDALDRSVESVARQFPGTVGTYTQSQAQTFPSPDLYRVLGSGLDLSLYEFCDRPKSQLAWVGRIAPEKGLEDAVAACQETGIPLKILGKMQDRNYWHQICGDYPDAPVEYVGFFPTEELQAHLRQCRGLLMTPRWVEAFGNVAIEALACGVPVIAYKRGGPAEIVREGETGFLVEPDRVDGLIEAIAKLDKIDRQTCRDCAEAEYSLAAWGDRIEHWFAQILDRADERL